MEHRDQELAAVAAFLRALEEHAVLE